MLGSKTADDAATDAKRGLLTLWRLGAESRAARRTLIGLVWKISPGLAIAAVAIIIVTVVASLASMFAAGALVGAIPKAVQAVQAGRGAGARRDVLFSLVVIAVVFVYQQVLGPFTSLVVQSLGRRVNGALRVRVMRAMLKPPGIAHLERPDLLDKVRDAQGVGEGQHTPGGVIEALVNLSSARLNSLACTVILAGFNVWLALVLLIYCVVVRFRLVADLLNIADATSGQSEELRRADYVRDTATAVESAKETRVFGLTGFWGERFRAHWWRAMEQLWTERKERNAPLWTWSIPWGGLTGFALFLIGKAAVDGEISLAAVTVYASATFVAGGIWISDADMQLAFGAAAVPAVLALEAAVADVEQPSGGTEDPAGRPRQEIRFDKVCFRYPGRDTDVYSGLDFAIEAGTSVAIVGANGAGKTTFVKLLARLYDPVGGAIKVDGIDLRSFPPEQWQRRIAAIFQDFSRFELAARDNVGFGAVDRQWTDDELTAVASKVGADEFITSLPNGWDTVLSRRFTDGAELSGGQWQRIALARAMAAVEAGASVLILDEPTANLDVRAEAELFDRFLEITEGLTTILISHRFSSVRHVDRIFVLEDGAIVESGSHAELLAAGGRYAHMFNLQAARFA